MSRLFRLSIFILSFIFSFYALSGVKYENFTNVKTPKKVWLLHLLLSFGLAYLVGEFVLAFTLFD